MEYGLAVTLDELVALKRFVFHLKKQSPIAHTFNPQHASAFKGRGMTFSEARHYQAGDEVRHMDWRVTARTGRPHVKVFEEERERPVILLTDFTDNMYFGTHIFKSVLVAQLSALIAWFVFSQGDRIGTFLYTDDELNILMPSKKEGSLLQLLSILSQATYRYQTIPHSKKLAVPLAYTLERLVRVVKPGASIICLSDFYTLDASAQKLFTQLRLHNELFLCRILDPIERVVPPPGYYPVTDGHREYVLPLRDTAQRAIYQAWCDEQTQRFESLAKRIGARYQQIGTNDDLLSYVMQLFLRRQYG